VGNRKHRTEAGNKTERHACSQQGKLKRKEPALAAAEEIDQALDLGCVVQRGRDNQEQATGLAAESKPARGPEQT
jgi:hypothetical protein